jgi:hypothetical protein
MAARTLSSLKEIPVTEIKGVGGKMAEALAKLDPPIETVATSPDPRPQRR